MSDRINKLPKLDLHCHLDGSLSRVFVEEVMGRPVAMEELEVGPDCRNLAEYLEKFDLPLACLQTPEGLRRAGEDFLLNLAGEGMDYVEVRFAPLLSANPQMDVSTVIQSLLEGLERGKERTGISWGVIVCAMRHHMEEDNWNMLKAAREYLGAGVCAADLAGNEAAYPMRDFRNLFEKVKKLDFPFTLHAGECGSVENIIQSVEVGAARIGHGIAMSGHKEAMELCRRNHVGIELCPISNGQTRAIDHVAQYPLGEFLAEGLLATVNTDNRTVSHTSIKREMAYIQEHYHISEEQIRTLTLNAIECSFASEEVKHELWKKAGETQ